MKATLTAILLFIFTLCFSQNYKTLVGEADAFYKNKEYKKSVEKYTAAFSVEQKSPEDLYNAACSAALLGNNKVAFQWLQLALNKGWSNVNHLTSDSDLKSLHNDKKWPQLVSDMQKVVDAREANYDKPLQAKLLALFEEDQNIRK